MLRGSMTNLIQPTATPIVPTPASPNPSGGDTVLIPVKLCNLPPFRPAVFKLLTCSEQDADLRLIVSLVGGDPALAAEILFLANSSLFGFPARIQSLRHAVAVLGLDCVKQLAATLAMRGLANGAGPFVRSTWCHSLASAIIAAQVAPVFGATPEQAYTAGLLHDVGRLGFLRSYAPEIGPVLAAEYEDAADLIAAERRTMNASHGEAGAWLIEYWALPVAFSEISANHHDPMRESDSPLLKTIKLASRLADAAGYSPVRFRSRLSYDEVLRAEVPNIHPSRFPDEVSLRLDIESRLRAFD